MVRVHPWEHLLTRVHRNICLHFLLLFIGELKEFIIVIIKKYNENKNKIAT